MIKKFLLHKTLVKKIAAATNAQLILQWVFHHSVTRYWNATDPAKCAHVSEYRYHIMLVVDDTDERSSIELMAAVQQLCIQHCAVNTTVFRKKAVLRKLKTNNADFSTVYRLGYCLFNADKKAFPKPGYARDPKQAPIPEKVVNVVSRYF
jgi:hypothetical protein